MQKEALRQWNALAKTLHNRMSLSLSNLGRPFTVEPWKLTTPGHLSVCKIETVTVNLILPWVQDLLMYIQFADLRGTGSNPPCQSLKVIFRLFSPIAFDATHMLGSLLHFPMFSKIKCSASRLYNGAKRHFCKNFAKDGFGRKYSAISV